MTKFQVFCLKVALDTLNFDFPRVGERIFAFEQVLVRGPPSIF